MNPNARRHVNLFLILIGGVGFLFTSFYLIYYKIPGGFFICMFFMILFLEAYILRIRVPEHQPDFKPEKIIHSEPLSSGFMLTSMLGIVISLLMVAKYSLTWGVTFTVIFAIMFIASMVSMTRQPVLDNDLINAHMEQLAFHNRVHRKKR